MRTSSLTDLDDAALVDRTRSGAADAFGELFRRHQGAVRLAVSDRTRDPEAQRDLVQEAFTRALAKLDALREPSAFRPWVLQIARNVAVDDLRSRLQLPTADLEAGPEPAGAAEDDPGLVVEMRALADAITVGLAAASPRDAAALAMVVHLGFGTADVAAALGISNGNARVVLHRARARLREALVQQDLLREGSDR